MSFRFTPARKVALGVVAAAGLATAAPLTTAQAQPAYGYGYQTGPDNEITVYGSRRHAERDYATGMPYEWVRDSKVVYYGDLNLRTRSGARALSARVWRAADDACRNLDFAYPMQAPDNPPCRRTAYRNAMEQTPIAYYGDGGYGY